MTLFAVSLDHRHKAGEFLKLIPGLVLTSMEGIILHIAIMGARLYVSQLMMKKKFKNVSLRI